MAVSLVKNVSVDNRYDQYDSIFGFEWSKEILARVDGTPLEAIFFSLAFNWRAVANTHRLPWLVVHSTVTALSGFKMSEHVTTEFVRAVAKRIPSEMTVDLRNMQREDLTKTVNKIADEYNDSLEKRPPEQMLDPVAAWKALLDEGGHEFQVSVYGAMQLVYGGIFAAYETFVTDLVEHGNSGNPSFERPFTWKGLVKTTAALFDSIDPAIATYCLEDPFVNQARLARNCLMHRGGRQYEQFRALNHNLLIVDDHVNIMAPDNRRAMREFEPRVTRLVDAALTMPQFK